jgi:glycosyltransferase involved in cell wall biosynthesis
MKIAIIGTRGIPNNYGGFEQFAQYLSLGLVERGNNVTVYNSDTHHWKEKEWNGVQIVHCHDPEKKMGAIGQFIYDLNCINDTRKRNFDIILQLGYTSSSIWGWLLPRKNTVVTTNMDGLEWQRTKYSKKVQDFLKYAEKLGVKYSDHLISDSVVIQKYLKEKYNRNSVFIPYGANVFKSPCNDCLAAYNITAHNYNMLIARLEPENNIETILDGVEKSNLKQSFLVIGNHETKYGNYLKEKFKTQDNIRFIGGIYDINTLNNLRHFSNLYFHGHTVGGTNPSLLEAMASQCLICAHDNIFNKSVLGQDGFYFKDASDVAELLNELDKSDNKNVILNNEKKIINTYGWSIIVNQYLAHFTEIVKR